jgi:tetratricopeptide (TPR) repeat protein
MIHMRALGLAIVLAVTALGGVGGAWAADERPQRAKEMFAAGRYPEALELFAKLYAETLDPLYLRVIGRCHQKMEDPDRAIDAFKEYLRKSKRLAPDKRKEVEGFIAEMEALKEHRRRQAAEEARRQTATAPPPLVVAPSAPPTSPGPLPPSLNAPAPSAPTDAVLVSPPPPDDGARTAPIYKRWWFWATIAAVAVAGGVVAATTIDRGQVEPFKGDLAPGVVSIPGNQ